jgi:AraC-like DNA-binding protein
MFASRQAEKLGEAYIFSCPAGLIHCTVPVIRQGTFKGAVIAGPILLDFPDDLMVDEIIQKFNLSLKMRGTIKSSLSSVPVIEPFKATHLSNLLFIVVSTLLGEDKLLLNERNKRLIQQSQINESIQVFKTHGDNMPYPIESEKELLLRVRNRDIIGARKHLNEIIGHVFFSSGGDMDIIRKRTLSLCALLSRASVEGGADLNKVFEISDNLVSDLSKIDNLEDLSFWILNILDKFTESVIVSLDPKNASIIQKSIAFINSNYKNSLTLDNVASHVHLNPSYFSSLFKKEMGLSFSSYLNHVRIEHGKKLLETTDYSILRIALEVGFEEQSYFTKVFKSITGQTPKEYKRKLN